MAYKNNKRTDINICYIGGGSQGWAWKLMSDLYLENSLGGTIRLYDIDHEAARANEAIGNIITSYGGEENGKWEYQYVSTLQEGLIGADFIIISILPATFKEMASDVHTPEKYGIYQSVGDSTGPGGLFRALRTIPMYELIAQSIQAFAPKAWVINYTNPMALCTGALYEVFPGIKAFGCCHEVFGAQRLLLMALADAGIEETDRHKLNTNVVGINHFTWITEAAYKQYDLVPMYRAFVEKHSKGLSDKQTDPHFASLNLVKFDLFNRYGVIAAAGDRHMAEFAPEYIGDDEYCKEWGYMLTPVAWRVKNRENLIKLSKQYIKREIPVPIEESGEEGVRQIKALVGLGDITTNVNLPNRGQMSAPENVVVETNAIFSYNNVRPVLAGGLPDELALRMNTHMANQRAILKAALARDTDLALAAFANDPLIKQISHKDACSLFVEMFNNTKEYLPGYSL